MKTRLLSAAVSAPLLLASGFAQAQIPILNTYFAGNTDPSHTVAVAMQTSGDPHVIFADEYISWEWDPIGGGSWPISSTYYKRFDATAYFASADTDFGYGAWDFDNQTWIGLGTPGASRTDEFPTAYQHMVAFGEQLSSSPEPGLTIVDVVTGSRGHLLDANGRHERLPALYQNTIAYEYDAGGAPQVSVHDLSTNVEIFHSSGIDASWPDLVAGRVAYESNGWGIIVWEDIAAGSWNGIAPPGGCTTPRRPLFGGAGAWITYAADCGGGWELWLHDINTGADQYIDAIRDPEFVHAVGKWLVYSDRHGNVVLVEFDMGPLPPTYVPVDASYASGVRGTDPTVVVDHSQWHAVFASGGDTIDWVPGNYLNAVGRAMSAYDGLAYHVAAMQHDEIWVYDLTAGSWDHVGYGSYPTMYKGLLAWTDPYASIDEAIGWAEEQSGGFATGVSLDGNGTDERLPAVFEDIAAIEYDNGSDWDIMIVDVRTGTPLVHMGRRDNQTRPDIFERGLVYIDEVQGLLYQDDFNTGADQAVPLSPNCGGARLPRLGGHGNLVVFEATGCLHGLSELRLVNMDTGSEWLVDFVAPPSGLKPQYAIGFDQLVYVDASGEVIYLDLDESSL